MVVKFGFNKNIEIIEKNPFDFFKDKVYVWKVVRNRVWSKVNQFVNANNTIVYLMYMYHCILKA